MVRTLAVKDLVNAEKWKQKLIKCGRNLNVYP